MENSYALNTLTVSACALKTADESADTVGRHRAIREIIARAAEARQELLDLLEAHGALQAAIHAAGYRVKLPPRPADFPQENITGGDA